MRQSILPAAFGGENRHVVLFGRTGSGKTSIFEQLVGKDKIEAEVRVGGSKYNPVVGRCRLGHAGEVTVIDTAGLDDVNELGSEQAHHTRNIIRRADIALYVINIQEFDHSARAAYRRAHDWMERNMVPYLQVFNRCDEAYAGDIAKLKTEFPEAVFISTYTPGSVSLLRARLSQMVRALHEQEDPLVPEELIQKGDYVLLLVPDSGLIHEYAIIMELMRRGARCVIIHEDDLETTMREVPRIDLVVAYARSFGKVRDIVPEDIPLTSYSLLYALQSGVLGDFVEGARAIGNLTKDSRVLIAVGNKRSEVYMEIGRIKIPRALRRLVGEELQIDYFFGLDLPDDLNQYDLVIHDAGAAMSRRSVQARVAICKEAGVPVANYGTILAALSGILDRCKKVLLPEEEEE
ncbi:MAG: 50S ribosome-binding GTPase [Clostridia bacterium]|nr:50S ribosome-binding GTPase [Clostridia bacterium]